MTKTEKRKLVTKRFFEWVNVEFPEYETVDETGGRIGLIENNNNSDSTIEYSRGNFDVCCLNWAPSKTQSDCNRMRVKLDELVKEIMESE